jgi:hypothetical protein
MKPTAAALLGAFLLGGPAPALAASDAPPAAIADDAVKALALRWFADMQTGKIDRSELAPQYSAQLDAAAVQAMAKYMQDHAYGAPPLTAEIVNERKIDDQAFYVVKLVFPRGDAASLMIGLNPEGKITGLNLMSMAGD